MQVIKTDEHTKYFCPLKFQPISGYTVRCDGPKCMWWNYSTKEVFRHQVSCIPLPPLSEVDETRGYCGK